MADCPGSGVVVDEDDVIRRNPHDRRKTKCPVCRWATPVEPVEPEGTTPRWRLVDHQEAS